MVANIETTFNCSAATAWGLLKKRDTFLYITQGFLGFSGSKKWPAVFHSGLVISTRLFFFHVLPGWRHVLRIIRLDAGKHELYSNESGGPIKTWNHLIRIEPVAYSRCRYLDRVEINAGILTPFIWGYAHVFYRYRQFRWTRLIRWKINPAER